MESGKRLNQVNGKPNHWRSRGGWRGGVGGKKTPLTRATTGQDRLLSKEKKKGFHAQLKEKFRIMLVTYTL